MEKTFSSYFAKIFVVFAGLFLLSTWLMAEVCANRPTSAQPGSPLPTGTVFTLGNNGSYGYFHDYQTHLDDVGGNGYYSACAVDMNVGSTTSDEGLPIIAVADGVVSSISNTVGWVSGFGNTVVIEHSSNTRSWYSHLAFDPNKKPGLKAGDTVRRGSVIGFLGGSGMASSPHLHFEWQEKDGNGVWKSMDFATMDGQTVSSGAQLTVTINNALVFADVAVTYPDGTFVKNINSDTIYYVDNSQLRAFTSSEHFRSWLPYYTVNMPIRAVLPVAGSSTISAYTMGPNMSFRPGTLLRSDATNDNTPNSTYYLVYNDNGTIRKTPKTFSQISAMGYEEGSAMVVPASLISALPGGSTGSAEIYQNSLYSDSSLVAYWRFEGNSSDSKNGHNGTDTSISYNSSFGKFGQGVRSPGNVGANYINVSDSSAFHFTGSFTVSAWLRVASWPAGTYDQFWLWGQTMSGGSVMQFFKDADGLQKVRLIRNNQAITLQHTMSTGSWHLITMVYDGSTSPGAGYIYVDGSLLGSGSPYTNNPTSWGDIRIGESFQGNIGNIDIDDLAVFSRVLTATEIVELYGGGI